MKRQLKESRFDGFFTLFVVLAPLLNSYSFLNSPLSIAEALLCVLSLWGIFTQKLVINNRWYFAFWGYFIVQTLCMTIFSIYGSVESAFIRLGRDSLYLFAILLLCPAHFQLKQAVKWYIAVAEATALFLFLQVILHHLFHWDIPNLIPGITLHYNFSSQTDYYQYFQRVYQYNYRPSSVFLEPAHMAQYCAPAVLLALFNDRFGLDRSFHYFIRAVMITGAVLLTTSANGVAFLVIAWGFWFFKTENGRIPRWKIWCALAMVVLFVATLFTPQMQKIIQRFMSIGDTSTGELSSGMRLVRGFIIFGGLPLVNQLTGTGLGQLESAIPYYGLSTAYDVVGSTEYMNTLAYMLNSVGLLGFILFLCAILSYSSSNVMSNRLLLLFAAMMAAGYIYSSPTFLLMIALISSGKKWGSSLSYSPIFRQVSPYRGYHG